MNVKLRWTHTALCLYLCLLAVGLPTTAEAQTAQATAEKRPRIGLALSGGGARGFSHVGVLKALEKLRVPVDCIAGTSAGSAVGAAYALGLSPEEIEAHLREADWDGELFNDQPPRQDLPYRNKESSGRAPLGITLGVGADGVKTTAGIFAGQKIELFLHRMLGYSAELDSFDRLPIPFRALATDLVTGEKVVLHSGSLVHSVKASMAVPSVFSPVPIAGRKLVDGGLTQNLPVETVRDTCADVVIAINIGSPLLNAESLDGVLSVSLQIVSILMERNVIDSKRVLGARDVLITPELGDLGAVDFANGVRGIPAGEAATLAAHTQLAALALPEAQYAAWQTQRRQNRLQQPLVGGVVVNDTRYVNPDYFALKQFNKVAEPGPVNAAGLERRINQWTGSGDFTNIAYSLKPGQDGYTLWIDPQEKPWGPNYLQIGIAGTTDSNSYTDFSVSAVLRQTWQNSAGAQWISKALFGRRRSLETSWYQPFSFDSSWYFEPRLKVLEEPRRVFVGEQLLGEFTTTRQELEIGLGYNDTRGEAHVGWVSGEVKVRPSSGFTGIQGYKSSLSGLRARLVMATLDDLDFPRKGYAGRIEGFISPGASGPIEDYRRWDVEWLQALSWGRHSVRGRIARSTVNSDGSGPLDLVTSGGFLRLSGYQNGQFLSKGLSLASLTYYQQLLGLPRPLGAGVFAGVSLEYAKLQSPLGLEQKSVNKSSLAVFMGASTALGPVYLGLGLGDHGKSNLYLYLGRP